MTLALALALALAPAPAPALPLTRRDCLHALLVAGADVSLRAKGAGTAAHVAAARDNEACLQVLPLYACAC